MISELAICAITGSVGYIYRCQYIWVDYRWINNRAWVGICAVAFVTTIAILAASGKEGDISAGSWTVFVLYPIFSLVVQESYVKKHDIVMENRGVMFRRLQFETKLGMWSPK